MGVCCWRLLGQMHELPEALRRKTLRYFEAQWNLENGVDVSTVFNELPEFLKADIKLEMHQKMVQLIPTGCVCLRAQGSTARVCWPSRFDLGVVTDLRHLQPSRGLGCSLLPAGRAREPFHPFPWSCI